MSPYYCCDSSGGQSAAVAVTVLTEGHKGARTHTRIVNNMLVSSFSWRHAAIAVALTAVVMGVASAPVAAAVDAQPQGNPVTKEEAAAEDGSSSSVLPIVTQALSSIARTIRQWTASSKSDADAPADDTVSPLDHIMRPNAGVIVTERTHRMFSQSFTRGLVAPLALLSEIRETRTDAIQFVNGLVQGVLSRTDVITNRSCAPLSANAVYSLYISANMLDEAISDGNREEILVAVRAMGSTSSTQRSEANCNPLHKANRLPAAPPQSIHSFTHLNSSSVCTM